MRVWTSLGKIIHLSFVFGDGEINLIVGHSIAYQDYHPELARSLRELVGMNSTEKTLSLFARCFRRSLPIYMVGRRFLEKAFGSL